MYERYEWVSGTLDSRLAVRGEARGELDERVDAVLLGDERRVVVDEHLGEDVQHLVFRDLDDTRSAPSEEVNKVTSRTCFQLTCTGSPSSFTPDSSLSPYSPMHHDAT